MPLQLEWTEKNENRVIAIGAIIFAVGLTILGVVYARYKPPPGQEVTAPGAASSAPSSAP